MILLILKRSFFLLAILIGIYSCKKNEAGVPVPSYVEIDDVEIFKGKADGEKFEYLDMNGFSAYTMFADSMITDDSMDVYSLGGYIENWDDWQLGGFTMGTITTIEDFATKAEFEELFAPGNHNYTEEGGEGVVVYFHDGDAEYRSDWGSGNQSGSSFEIMEIKDDLVLGSEAMRVLARFNCKVYSENGESVNITDGELLFEVITHYEN